MLNTLQRFRLKSPQCCGERTHLQFQEKIKILGGRGGGDGWARFLGAFLLEGFFLGFLKTYEKCPVDEYLSP